MTFYVPNNASRINRMQFNKALIFVKANSEE